MLEGLINKSLVWTDHASTYNFGFRETGSSVAVPIFKDFIENYYKNKPILPFTIPKGIELIKIDFESGKIVNNLNKAETIYEAFSKSDNLVNNFETLTGADGFQIIQVEEDLSDDYVLY